MHLLDAECTMHLTLLLNDHDPASEASYFLTYVYKIDIDVI
jgi:hypothetical protein